MLFVLPALFSKLVAGNRWLSTLKGHGLPSLAPSHSSPMWRQLSLVALLVALATAGPGAHTRSSSVGVPRACARRAPIAMGANSPPAPWDRSSTGKKSAGGNQYERREGLVRGMLLPQPKSEFMPPLAEDDPVAPLVMAIALAGDDKKARSIKAIRVSALTTVTSFFVTMTGKTKTQVSSIGANVRDELRLRFGRDAVPQGDPASGWVVLDYGDAIVHIFTPEVKAFYELEKLWKNGQELALGHVVSEEGLSEPTDEDDDLGFGLGEEADEIWGDDDADIWG